MLPLRVFVNRKQLLQNNTRDNSFHTPLLSSNSIVYIKSPATRIYLSNHDMHNLCTEITTDIFLILYELSSPKFIDGVLKNVRIGQTLDFQKDVMEKLNTDSYEGLLTTHIQSLTRVAKSKVKLHFKKNWELDIFINSLKKLADMRSALLLKECGSVVPAPRIYSRRRVLLTETISTGEPILAQEEDPSPIGAGTATAIETAPVIDEDKKPSLTFRYRTVASLSDCIDVHVLQRPKRRRDPPVGP